MFFTSETHVSQQALKIALNRMNDIARENAGASGLAVFHAKEVKHSNEHEYVITNGTDSILPVHLHVTTIGNGLDINLFVHEVQIDAKGDEAFIEEVADNGIQIQGNFTQREADAALEEMVDVFAEKYAPAWRMNTDTIIESMAACDGCENCDCKGDE